MNRFDGLNKSLASRQEAAQPDIPRARRGKRSDPNYVQIGAYIPRDLQKQLKLRLAAEEIELSDLVEQLLMTWLAK